jgi:hypothetical protein
MHAIRLMWICAYMYMCVFLLCVCVCVYMYQSARFSFLKNFICVACMCLCLCYESLSSQHAPLGSLYESHTLLLKRSLPLDAQCMYTCMACALTPANMYMYRCTCIYTCTHTHTHMLSVCVHAKCTLPHVLHPRVPSERSPQTRRLSPRARSSGRRLQTKSAHALENLAPFCMKQQDFHTQPG